MKKAHILQKVALTSVLVLMLAGPAYAGGDTKTTEKEVCVTQYGGGTECHKEIISEEITHETVDAGLEDFKYLPFAGMLAGIGIAFLILSKITKKVYVLDN